MLFVKIPGIQGKLYVPRKPAGCPAKHPCRDCFACQHCSDDRCRVCRGRPPAPTADHPVRK